MHKRLLCSHLHRSLKKLEGTAVLIIFVFCGPEEARRSKEKQEEEEEERQRPDLRRKQKSKQEEASQSQRFTTSVLLFWAGCMRSAQPLIFCALRSPVKAQRRGGKPRQASKVSKQEASRRSKKQAGKQEARSKKKEEGRKKKQDRGKQ